MNLVFLESDIPSIPSDQPWKNSKMISVHLSDLTFSIPFQVYVPNSMECWNFFVKEKKVSLKSIIWFWRKRSAIFLFFFLLFDLFSSNSFPIKKISKIYDFNYMGKNASKIKIQLNIADISKTIVQV